MEHRLPMVPRVRLWLGAFTGFARPTADALGGYDAVAKFLYAARSVILVISAQAAAVAGLLAWSERSFHPLPFAALLVGFVALHAISNLSNDYFGLRRGDDTAEAPRRRYTVHPFADGVVEPRVVWTGAGVLATVAALSAAYCIALRGWPAAVLAAVGVAILFLYDAAPRPLKALGLGEVAAFVVWGPLMVGGGTAMVTGRWSLGPFLASVPYGLGVMSILVGKHIDQRDFDAAHGHRTLPVVLGTDRARWLAQAVVGGMYGTLALAVAAHAAPWPALAAAGALPLGVRTLDRLGRPRPAAPPAGYVGWPLWYHRACLAHHRRFAWLYLAGLAVGALVR
jgi:1,4-dihydroxy-2-naphthoate octaprenyltransferase